jgi:hypothetical protein
MRSVVAPLYKTPEPPEIPEPPAFSLAQQLAGALNAVAPGSASASGNTVTLLANLSLTVDITAPPGVTLVVPSGITLDLATNHKSITLDNNAVLTVDGVVNTEAAHDKDGNPIGGNGRLLVDSAAGSAATINGIGVVHLKSRGRLLQIDSGKELTLDGAILDGLMTAGTATGKNITLPPDYADSADNDAHLVYISPGGTFTMEDGEICGNRQCGLNVGGSFTMNGGVIHSNVAMTDGGGLIVNGGTFTMNGGVIRNNRANYGGGVRLWGPTATFIMAGGTVYGGGAGTGLANTGSLSGDSLSITIGNGNAYWGDGTTGISTSNGTLTGGNPTGTIT